MCQTDLCGHAGGRVSPRLVKRFQINEPKGSGMCWELKLIFTVTYLYELKLILMEMKNNPLHYLCVQIKSDPVAEMQLSPLHSQ